MRLFLGGVNWWMSGSRSKSQLKDEFTSKNGGGILTSGAIKKRFQLIFDNALSIEAKGRPRETQGRCTSCNALYKYDQYKWGSFLMPTRFRFLAGGGKTKKNNFDFVNNFFGVYAG